MLGLRKMNVAVSLMSLKTAPLNRGEREGGSARRNGKMKGRDATRKVHRSLIHGERRAISVRVNVSMKWSTDHARSTARGRERIPKRWKRAKETKLSSARLSAFRQLFLPFPSPFRIPPSKYVIDEPDVAKSNASVAPEARESL